MSYFIDRDCLNTVAGLYIPLLLYAMRHAHVVILLAFCVETFM